MELHKCLTNSLLERKLVNAPFTFLYGCNVRNHTLTSFENGFVRSWSRLLIMIVGVSAINKRINDLVLGPVTKVWKCFYVLHPQSTHVIGKKGIVYRYIICRLATKSNVNVNN